MNFSSQYAQSEGVLYHHQPQGLDLLSYSTATVIFWNSSSHTFIGLPLSLLPFGNNV
jgi:hypothetical protein